MLIEPDEPWLLHHTDRGYAVGTRERPTGIFLDLADAERVVEAVNSTPGGQDPSQLKIVLWVPVPCPDDLPQAETQGTDVFIAAPTDMPEALAHDILVRALAEIMGEDGAPPSGSPESLPAKAAQITISLGDAGEDGAREVGCEIKARGIAREDLAGILSNLASGIANGDGVSLL